MKAIVQEKAGGKLSVQEIPIPEPGPGEVLVKMKYAPINPSDLSQLEGTYASRPDYPFVPGIEGCGQVVKSGRGFIPRIRKGRRVACTTSANRGGTWAEYMVTSALKTIPLDNKISDEKGAMLLVNPLTALAFVEIAKRGKHKVILNNAAASSLGLMLNYMCSKNNISLINIVTKDTQENYLKKHGAKNILNSSSENYENELADTVRKLNCHLFFDAVGGDQAEILIRLSPPGSTLVSYAKLSEQNIEIDTRLILQHNKKIQGFFLGKYTSDNSVIQNLSSVNKVKKMLAGDMEINISARYPFNSASKAVDYYRNNMSAGKVLFFSEESKEV